MPDRDPTVGIGLSYGPARLHRLAARCNKEMSPTYFGYFGALVYEPKLQRKRVHENIKNKNCVKLSKPRKFLFVFLFLLYDVFTYG
jgi:hypothetical protein